jgi:drug/metabolite transporter (DMT)-like permease
MALAVLFGANVVAIKVSLRGLGPLTASGLRFTIAAFIVTIWALLTKRTLRLRPGQWRHLAVLVPLYTAQMALFYLGTGLTHASRATLLGNLQPFLVLLMAHYFLPGDRMTFRKAVGVLLGLLGVSVLFFDPETLTGNLKYGDVLILASVALWSISTIYVKRIIEDFEPFHLALHPMLLEAPILLLAGYYLDEPALGRIDFSVVAALTYQSVVSAAFGLVVWMHLAQKYGAVALNSFGFLMPVAGVLLSGALLGEPIAKLPVMLALSLVVIGVLWVNPWPRRNEASVNELRGT